MSNDCGKVSIIVPVYNVEKYFEQCINSLLEQTYRNIEILIVDDGSEDTCGEIADEYILKDERIKVFHKENGGVSSARNYGLENATGEFYGFVDSDDFVTSDYIEKMVTCAVEKDADMVISNFFSCFVNKNIPNSKLEKYPTGQIFTTDEFLEELYYHPGAFSFAWNKLYRKELFEGLKFADMLCEDSQIMLTLAERSKIIAFVGEPLYYYRRRKSSILNGKQEMVLKYELKWIGNHMKRLKAQNKDYLYYLAQKLYMSKILEKYIYCRKEIRRKLKNRLKQGRKTLLEYQGFGWKIKLKYSIVTRIPALYSNYYRFINHDNNTFWD